MIKYRNCSKHVLVLIKNFCCGYMTQKVTLALKAVLI